MSNSLDPDQVRRFVGPDLAPNCLRMLSADDTSRQRVNYACVQGSTGGTNGRPISFKVPPMVPLVKPLVPMVMSMVPLTTNDTIGKITYGTIGKPRTEPQLPAVDLFFGCPHKTERNEK